MSLTIPCRFPFARWFFVLASLVIAGASVAMAQFGPPTSSKVVKYNPNITQQLQGAQPLLYRYDMSITSPAALPAGTTQVTLTLTVEEAPPGVSATLAKNYITFVDPVTNLPKNVLTYTGPDQTHTVSVVTNIPVGAATGSFAYWITTAGWPAGLTDNGTRINAQVAPPSGLLPPSVTISSPANGSTYTHTAGSAGVEVPIRAAGEASPSAPVTALVVTLTGRDEANEIIMPETPVAVALTGLGTPITTARIDYPVSAPGIYTVKAVATNVVGSSTTTTTFIVDQTVPPPVVRITQPPAPVYTYYVGSPALTIPYVFEGESFKDGIRTLSAKLNGVPVSFTADDIGALIATGTGSFSLSEAGDYTLEVTATDDYGTATTSTSFRINVVRPAPQIVINTPENGTVITHTSGSPLPNVPFTFTVTTNTGFTISAVSAKLDGVSLPVTAVTGLGTATAVGSGTMVAVTPGTHILTAYGTSAGIEVSTSVSFTVNQVSPPDNTPPTVVIDSPAENSTFTLIADDCGGTKTLEIPLKFTGSSTTADAVITKLTAKLGNTALTVTSSNLNQKVSNGAATMKVTAAGTYTITVTATDKYGTATATRTFVVKSPAVKQQITGTVFFDVNFNGTKNSEDYGMSGVSVKLLDSTGRTLDTETTNSSGLYKFTAYPGSYTIEVADVKGMSATTLNDHNITVAAAAVTAPNTGYGLKFASIRTLCANGYSHGFWKNNIDKAIAGKTNGVQVSATAIKSYTNAIGSLALSPYDGLTMNTASSILGSNSSAASSLLSKQLIASEYNYANGAFIGGDRTLTYAFIYYGEYVLKNASSYGASYVTFVKDWFDAYNNSHGGKVLGPLP